MGAASTSPWAHSLLAPSPHIIFQVINLLSRTQGCSGLCFFNHHHHPRAWQRLHSSLQAHIPPRQTCTPEWCGYPPAAGAPSRCWSRWWRCGSCVGRCCRQPAMLCNFCGGPTSWQADRLPPGKGHTKNCLMSTKAGLAACASTEELERGHRGDPVLQCSQSPISHLGIAAAAVPGCWMHQAEPYGSSQTPPVSGGQREGGLSSCAPTSAWAPVATAHPSHTRRTGMGNTVQQGSPRYAVAAPLSWMIPLPHGHWERGPRRGVPPALSCTSGVW